MIKPKGPAPPPPDYPTLDKRQWQYSVQRLEAEAEAESAYDKAKKYGKKNKKKRKNSYTQNEIPKAPPPPTVSQNVSQDQFSDIHSLDRSNAGSTYPHDTPSIRSLNKSVVSSGSRRSKMTKSPSASQKGRARSKSPGHGLSLDRSIPGGYPTPNSHSLSRSLPRGTRFIPIDQYYANTINRSTVKSSRRSDCSVSMEQNYANTIDRSTVNSSRQSDFSIPMDQHYANTIDRSTVKSSVQSEPLRSRRVQSEYQNTGSRSQQNTPKSKQRALKAKGPQTPSSRIRSKSTRPTTPTSPLGSHDSGFPPSFHGSMNSALNSPMVGSHTSLQSCSPQFTRKSMYANMASKDLPMTTSLDRINVQADVDEHMYMDPIDVKTNEKPRPPQRAVSSEMISTPSRYQERMRKIRGPRFNINTETPLPTRSVSQQHLPPEYRNIEMTTPL